MKALNEETIDKLQNYFGIALRSKIITVKNLLDDIMASFFTLLAARTTIFIRTVKTHRLAGVNIKVVNGANFHKPGPGFPKNLIYHVKAI